MAGIDNPWAQLPTTPLWVLPCDREAVAAFNARYSLLSDFMVRPHLLPEPFVGNPGAAVYLLGLNPGYSPGDDLWHGDRCFQSAIRRNLGHEPSPCPFFYLDPQFAEAPGAGWWRRRLRWLMDAVGLQVLVTSLICIELFPYHSTRYRPVPKAISPDGLVPSAAYSAQLLRAAMREGKPVVAMRAFGSWCRVVPELRTYGNLYRLSSAQNVALSPNNLRGYDRLVGELLRAGQMQ